MISKLILPQPNSRLERAYDDADVIDCQ
jgi:hypothetical protein